MPSSLTEAEARELIQNGLGQTECNFIRSITAPIYWVLRDDSGKDTLSNGTVFFLNTGASVFGVTAAHVIQQLKKDREEKNVVCAQIGTDYEFNIDSSLIDFDEQIDIATFKLDADVIKRMGKVVLTGSQPSWPPLPPEKDKGVYIAGFPGVERKMEKYNIDFEIIPSGGIATSVSSKDVCMQIEREYLLPLDGVSLPPENMDFRGISGGPMLTVIERKGIRSWQLAGVIYEGPNTDVDNGIAGFEVIRARRVDFIHADGQLNRTLWEDTNL